MLDYLIWAFLTCREDIGTEGPLRPLFKKFRPYYWLFVCKVEGVCTFYFIIQLNLIIYDICRAKFSCLSKDPLEKSQDVGRCHSWQGRSMKPGDPSVHDKTMPRLNPSDAQQSSGRQLWRSDSFRQVHARSDLFEIIRLASTAVRHNVPIVIEFYKVQDLGLAARRIHTALVPRNTYN